MFDFSLFPRVFSIGSQNCTSKFHNLCNFIPIWRDGVFPAARRQTGSGDPVRTEVLRPKFKVRAVHMRGPRFATLNLFPLIFFPTFLFFFFFLFPALCLPRSVNGKSIITHLGIINRRPGIHFSTARFFAFFRYCYYFSTRFHFQWGARSFYSFFFGNPVYAISFMISPLTENRCKVSSLTGRSAE